MSKQIKFTDSDGDMELIKKITEYQKAHGLSSFIAAVRKLCNDSIQIEKIRH
jgi:hypothetical protein